MFISFEGGEGSGKTTQIRLLSEALTQKNIPHLVTREPGGTPLAERIRPLLVEAQPGEDWHPLAETLLFMAARVQHVEQVIKPALAAGKWVLCDRFVDSTLVYQGIGKGLGLAYMQSLHRLALGGFLPHKTFYLDLAPEKGLARAKGRNDGEQRFEQLAIDFHQRLREGFLQLAKQEPQRVTVIDAEGEAESVHQRVLSAFNL
jgi:dTMP kinase